MMEQRHLVSLEVVSLLVGDYYQFCDEDLDDDDGDCDDDHVYNLCVYYIDICNKRISLLFINLNKST